MYLFFLFIYLFFKKIKNTLKNISKAFELQRKAYVKSIQIIFNVLVKEIDLYI